MLYPVVVGSLSESCARASLHYHGRGDIRRKERGAETSLVDQVFIFCLADDDYARRVGWAKGKT